MHEDSVDYIRIYIVRSGCIGNVSSCVAYHAVATSCSCIVPEGEQEVV